MAYAVMHVSFYYCASFIRCLAKSGDQSGKNQPKTARRTVVRKSLAVPPALGPKEIVGARQGFSDAVPRQP